MNRRQFITRIAAVGIAGVAWPEKEMEKTGWEEPKERTKDA